MRQHQYPIRKCVLDLFFFVIRLLMGMFVCLLAPTHKHTNCPPSLPNARFQGTVKKYTHTQNASLCLAQQTSPACCLYVEMTHRNRVVFEAAILSVVSDSSFNFPTLKLALPVVLTSTRLLDNVLLASIFYEKKSINQV